MGVIIMVRHLTILACVLGSAFLPAQVLAEPTDPGPLSDHLDSAFIFINDNHPTPNIVSGWRTDASSVVLAVRDGFPIWDVEDLVRETFVTNQVERIDHEIWIHEATLVSVLQALSTVFLRSAPFRVADGLFVGCVILSKKSSRPQETTSTQRPWMITSSGVGDVVIGRRLPDAVLSREGVSRHALYQSGRLSRAGFLVVRLEHMKIQVTLLTDESVMSIRPSEDVKTNGDIGIGSNLKELKSAHQGVTLKSVSKPYTCAASSRDLPGVRFLFTDCNKACLGESKVREVIWSVPRTRAI